MTPTMSINVAAMAEHVQAYGSVGDVYDLLGRLCEEGMVTRIAEHGDAAIYLFTDGTCWGSDWGVMDPDFVHEVALAMLEAKRV
jgi:hypothetical protein